ncbi:MAG: prolyl oligopeptidase family serine peptidase [Candidatus Aminicenantes bacterium]|nr:prolyl oligopeptidase family serine peptidase [Candidatus Aminicenantes bacterium]
MIKHTVRRVVLILLASLAALSIQAAEKHPFGIEDMAALRSARPIAVVPDGDTILYGVSFGGAKGPTNREWHLIAADGSNARKLTLPDRFTPSGFMKDGAALYGMLGVERRSQLAIVPLATGKPTITIALQSGIRSASISPDGSRFALLADPRSPDPLAATRTVVESDETSLYVVNCDGSNGSWWCPSLKNISEIAWSADSSKIAVLSQTPKLGYHYVQSFVDVCAASGARRIAEIPNAAAGIAWAEGGSELAFLSTTAQVITPDHVWTVPVAGGKPMDRTPDLAGSALSLVGDTGGTVWVLVARGVRGEVHTLKNGILTPAHVWPERIILGTPVFQKIAGAPERLVFTVGAGYEEGKRYPYLVLPHGGPESNDFLYFDTWARSIAGLVYVVMQPQYRGSTGYGTDFLNAIYQHFGDRAYSDVDSATDYAIGQGWADPNCLAIFGGSSSSRSWPSAARRCAWSATRARRISHPSGNSAATSSKKSPPGLPSTIAELQKGAGL